MPGPALGARKQFTITAFRHCNPQHTEIAGATLMASEREGGRFNPQHAFGTLYVALSQETALRELYRRAERLGLQVSALLPRTMLRLRVRLTRVLDLCDTATAQDWGLSPEQLRHADLTACQEVGRAARRAGYEAIRFPAATGVGENLAIFMDCLLPRSSVTVETADPVVFE